MTPGPSPRVYVASPLGFSQPTRHFYESVLLPSLQAAGVVPLDPWNPPFDDLATAALLPMGPHRLNSLAAANWRHGQHNADLIVAADAVLAVLDGPDVDSGTAAEVGYAAALDKLVIGWRSDLRSSADNEATAVNLQVAYFISASGGAIFATLEDAVAALLRTAE